MKTKQLLTRLSIVAVAVAVTACGPTGGEGDEPITGAASPVEQSVAAEGTPYVGLSDEELGWRAEVPVTRTASLIVQDGFNFETSRRTVVSMFVPGAVGEIAEATFCTDYVFDGVDYDVNYDSCVLQAPLVDGQLHEEITLANQYSSVLGIVWLQDPDAAPVYQEFRFD